MDKSTLIQPSVKANAFLRQHLALVQRIAMRIQEGLPHRNALDDMIQAGMIVLWQVNMQGDILEEGEDFARRVSARIRGAMLDLLREEDWAPRRLRQKQRVLEKAAAEFVRKSQRAPTDAELALTLHWSLEDYHRHLVELGRACPFYLEDSLNRETSGLGDGSVSDQLPFQGDSLLDISSSAEWHQHLEQALKALPEKERTALALYYYEELTLEEVALVMGFKSKAYVLKLVNTATVKLRGVLQARDILT